MRAMGSDRDVGQSAVRAGAAAAQRMAGGELDVRHARMRAMGSDRDVAQSAVRAGAAAAQRMAGGELDVRRKTSAADLVSAADHASEEAIVALLRAERPGDAIVGEEGASVGAGARRWLVDGLDGTVNFLRAIPQWCVAVVLEEDGQPLATAVLDPVRGELFSASRGEGAHRDGVGLRVREGAPLREAVLSSFLRADKLRGTSPAASLGRLAEAAAVLRMGGAGSLELAWVAAGHIDAWAQPNVDSWDWLPGRLLVQEAGGRTAVIDGDPLTWFVAGAPGTFDELVALVSAGR
jgi:myo-inositol-1(or 4)-monophosphatase